MNNSQVDPKFLSEEQLKAIAYDNGKIITQYQASINVIEAELARRAEALGNFQPPAEKTEQETPEEASPESEIVEGKEVI
jgi:hypothetical protein